MKHGKVENWLSIEFEHDVAGLEAGRFSQTAFFNISHHHPAGDIQIHLSSQGRGHIVKDDSGKGVDRAFGGGGNDRIAGEDGKDRLFGQAGADLLFGNAARDLLSGGKGLDVLNGGGSRDRCRGGVRDRLKRC